MSGKFVVVEGMDGTGKTTLARQLYDALLASGLKADYLREPGSTPYGEALRDLMLGMNYMSPGAFLYGMLSARAHLCDKIITPALKDGSIIICDRYFPSTLVYQGRNDAKMRDHIVEAANAPWFVQPDLVITLDCEPETAMRRCEARGDKNVFDSAKLEVFKDRRDAYLTAVDTLYPRGNVLHCKLDVNVNFAGFYLDDLLKHITRIAPLRDKQ